MKREKINLTVHVILLIVFLGVSNVFATPNDDFEQGLREELKGLLNSPNEIEQFIEDMENYKPIHTKASKDSLYNMIIITSDSLEQKFLEFAAIKDSEGIATEVVTTTTTGSSADQVRAYLTSRKTNNDSLKYVLIGGDASIVMPKIIEVDDKTDYTSFPTDYYFSNVLSDWTTNGHINFDADLYVGRIPANTVQEVQNFIDKYQAYKQGGDYLGKYHLIANNIRRIPYDSTGNYIIDSIAAHMDADIDFTYEEDLADSTKPIVPPAVKLGNAFDTNEHGFVFNITHGGRRTITVHTINSNWRVTPGVDDYPHSQQLTCEYDWSVNGYDGDSTGYFYEYLPDYLTNSNPYILWNSCCASTKFVNKDDNPTECIGAYFMTDEHGAVAYYASSHYEYPYIAYYAAKDFMDCIFEDEVYVIGELFGEAYQRYYSRTPNSSCFTNLILAQILFGDPSMELYHEEPIIGDFNSDGYVDATDMQLFYDHWHLEEGDSGWDPLYDLNSDGIVDAADSQIFADHWHEGTPPTKEKDAGKGVNTDACIVLDMNANTAGNQNLVSLPLQSAGNSISVDVYCIDVRNLDTYKFEIVYNQDELSYVSSSPENPITSERNILTTDGGTPLGWMVDNSTPGRVSFAYTLTGFDEAQAPEGEGLIANIVFRTKADTYAAIRFGDVYYHDTFGVKDEIAHANSSLLPYALSSFTASHDPVNSYTTIDWTTSCEQAVNGFNVYRNTSDDFDSAIKLNQDIIAGHETSTEINEYSFVDEDALEIGTTYYYWLESVESNGMKGVCEPISLIPEEGSGGFTDDFDQTVLSNYPNPFRGKTTIAYGIKGMLKSTPVEIKIYNVLGQLVDTIEGRNGTATWDSSNHSAGIYFYKLSIDDYNEIRKMILSR